jgi:hypothetical protein
MLLQSLSQCLCFEGRSQGHWDLATAESKCPSFARQGKPYAMLARQIMPISKQLTSDKARKAKLRYDMGSYSRTKQSLALAW